MPTIETRNFGTVAYRSESVLAFPNGLPGFDERRSFIPIQGADTAPLVFLQSLEDPGLCFVTLPVLAVDRGFRLAMAEEDLETVGLPAGGQPRIGEDVLCLAIVSVREGGPTANLLAPVVVNLRNRVAVQAVAPDSGYSHQHQLLAPEEAMACS